MPMRCKVCDHKKRNEIEQAFVSESFRNIAKRFGMDASSVFRHKRDHCAAPLESVAVERKALMAEDLIGYLNDSLKQLGEIAIEARAAEDFRASVAAIAERTSTTLTTWQLLHPEPKQSSELPRATYGWTDQPTERSSTVPLPGKTDSTNAGLDTKASVVQ